MGMRETNLSKRILCSEFIMFKCVHPNPWALRRNHNQILVLKKEVPVFFPAAYFLTSTLHCDLCLQGVESSPKCSNFL